MQGTIVAIHSLGFMIKPDDGSKDVYFPTPGPLENHWKKRQRVSFTLKPAVDEASVRHAENVKLLHPPE